MSYCRWLVVTLVLIIVAPAALGFCGFYVGRTDTSLFNETSKVVIARHQQRTVITMASDYHGELSDFALVVPVPIVLERGQIHVTDNAIINHLDAYTSPRLVEYYDDDPCVKRFQVQRLSVQNLESAEHHTKERSIGVMIEAQYTVGEYDVLILSAQQSDGLQHWLVDNGYHTPESALPVLDSYIRQGMKFFVARVNLQNQAQQGSSYLRPLQIAFESKHFMLPIRLGMVNTRGAQDMLVFILSKNGRVETTNYRTLRLLSNVELPLFVRSEFDTFYQAMFDEAVIREKHKAVFMEYAWYMGWCDPCAADPMSSAQLRELGVHWIEAPQSVHTQQPKGTQPPLRDVFVTRLHVRYSSQHFPHDLLFRETKDRSNFQARYILRHPFRGDPNACKAATQYYAELPQRFANTASNLAQLTGWNINNIRAKMDQNGQSVVPPQPLKWWEKLWDK